MIGVARGVIAEPQLVNNALYGRESESRTCIAANHCSPYNPGHGCALNPTVAKEERWGVRQNAKAPRSMRVVVVGGGPSGMEAARVAAMRGHTVTLIERRARLGGALALVARMPGREHMHRAGDWWAHQLDRLGVEVRTATDADAETILALAPDAVMVATGALYAREGMSGFSAQPIPGWDQPFVLTPDEVLSGARTASGQLLIIDEEGRNAGVGTAEFLAAHGCRVTIVSSYDSAAPHMGTARHYIGLRLREAGVLLSLGTRVLAIGDCEVKLELLATGEQRTVPVDGVIMSTMRRQVDGLIDMLTGKVAYIYQIGDALAPRSLIEATYEGHKFARLLGEDVMPKTVIDELFRIAPGFRPAETLTAIDAA